MRHDRGNSNPRNPMDLDSHTGRNRGASCERVGRRRDRGRAGPVLREDVLSWRAPEIDPATGRYDRCLHLRQPHAGERESAGGPGERGDGATSRLRLQRRSGAAIYAQWEVAEARGRRVPQDKHRRRSFRVATSAPSRSISAPGRRLAGGRSQSSDAPPSDSVGIVAFSDHLWRCVTTARRSGSTPTHRPATPCPATTTRNRASRGAAAGWPI